MSASSEWLLKSVASGSKFRDTLTRFGGDDMVARFEQMAEGLALAEAMGTAPLPLSEASLTAATSLACEPSLARGEAAGLLEHSELLTIGGRRHLRLRDDARADLLKAAVADGSLASLLDRRREDDSALLGRTSADEERDADLASAFLRAYMRNEAPALKNASVRHLRAAADAVRALSACRDLVPDLPSIGEIERLFDLAELRQPLEILIGTRPDGGDDRFAGREDELKALRIFIDVLESQGALESVSRGFQRVGRVVRGSAGLGSVNGMTLVARGGLGKSALVAKFALDHFLNAASPLPFVYLDFDRASLQPSEPDQLLIEAARHLALEFPAFAARLDAVRALLRRRLAERDRVTRAGSAPPVDNGVETQFASILRELASASGSPAFLVVLDTMEAIQGDPAAMAGVREFVKSLWRTGVPQLRLVAAGRAEIEELDGVDGLVMSPRVLRLEPFNVTDARSMVAKLGRDLLGEEWRQEWTHLIAGKASDPAERREPLTLRVSVEFVRDRTSFEERDALAREIGRLGESATVDFVGRLYERRVLGHVRDDDVRKVAWPGLVARRITKALLAEVIAPMCGLSPDRVDATFDKLAREVWIVDRDGDALVHRPDLRSRTLPLMRRSNPDLFDALVVALRDYFAKCENQVETAYYRLLQDEAPDFLVTDLAADIVNRLAPAADDFPPDSPTRAYLRSRTGPLMARSAFGRLPPEFAFSHLAKAGSALRGLDDQTVSRMLTMHRGAPVMVDRLSQADLAARQTVLIKTGQWSAIDPYALVLPRNLQDATALAFFLGRAGADFDTELAADFALRLLHAFGATANVQHWKIAAFLLPFLKTLGGEHFRRIDAQLADTLPDTMDDVLSNRAALRSAAVAGESSFTGLARHWARLALSGPNSSPTLSGGEAASLSELLQGDHFQTFLLRQISDVETAKQVLDLASAARGPAGGREKPLVMESLATTRLARWMLERGPSTAEHSEPLKRFFSARDEDWILPSGYAIQTALGTDGMRATVERFMNDIAYPKDRGLLPLRWMPWIAKPKPAPRRNDGVQIALRADEAGALDVLLGFAERAEGGEARQLRGLIDALDNWRQTRDRFAPRRTDSSA